MSSPQLNVNISPEDEIVCEKCNCPFFHVVSRVACVPSPMVGHPPIVAPTIKAVQCANCSYIFMPNPPRGSDAKKTVIE